MDTTERRAGNLELVGGRLCLDFTNTVSSRIEALHQEYLTSYGELVAWSWHAHILTDSEAEALLARADRHADLAAVALDRAIALRETIYQLFSAIAVQREPDRRALATMNTVLSEAYSRAELAPAAGRFEWTWASDEDGLDWMLWPIVHSVADLLTSGDLTRVQQCAREGCDWLFVDLSKNHSRRWCSMDMCGSRVKSRRYYYRTKSKGRAE